MQVINENECLVTLKDEDNLTRDDLIGTVTLSLARAREQGSDSLKAPVIMPNKKQHGFLSVTLKWASNDALRVQHPQIMPAAAYQNCGYLPAQPAMPYAPMPSAHYQQPPAHYAPQPSMPHGAYAPQGSMPHAAYAPQPSMPHGGYAPQGSMPHAPMQHAPPPTSAPNAPAMQYPGQAQGQQGAQQYYMAPTDRTSLYPPVPGQGFGGGGAPPTHYK